MARRERGLLIIYGILFVFAFGYTFGFARAGGKMGWGMVLFPFVVPLLTMLFFGIILKFLNLERRFTDALEDRRTRRMLEKMLEDSGNGPVLRQQLEERHPTLLRSSSVTRKDTHRS